MSLDFVTLLLYNICIEFSGQVFMKCFDINYNFHTHTYFCSHAVGEIEDYIKRAISCGVKKMGFSDHIPLKFPDGKESFYRVPTDKVCEYFRITRELREKYKGEIDIKIGFESEYYPQYFSEMLRSAIEYGAEYLILGQHFYEPENIGYRRTIDKTDDEASLTQYCDLVTEAIETRVFSYVAHPDIVNFCGDEKIFFREVRKIAEASLKHNIPLEINLLGIREGRNYPNPLFWQIVGEVGSPVTFGFDSHDIQAAYDGESLPFAFRLVRECSLNYIGEPRLLPISDI